MANPGTADVIEAMERFLARIEPFEPQPGGVPVLTVEMRQGRLRGRFEVTERAARALCEVLARYVDPDDSGRCGCGGYLDQNLQCRDCGQVSGVFGSTIAARAAEVAARDGG